MADFNLAALRLASFEGEYSNLSADRGGETYAGISRRWYPTWSGWSIVDAYKPDRLAAPVCAAALQVAVHAFYRHYYWDPLRCEELQRQDIATELFEQAVNLGARRAVEHLQRAVNVVWLGTVAVDSIIGPVTLGVVNRLSPDQTRGLLRVMNILQGYHYITLCERDPAQEVFALGWLSRT